MSEYIATRTGYFQTDSAFSRADELGLNRSLEPEYRGSPMLLGHRLDQGSMESEHLVRTIVPLGSQAMTKDTGKEPFDYSHFGGDSCRPKKSPFWQGGCGGLPSLDEVSCASEQPSFSSVMRDRWLSHCQRLTEADKEDIAIRNQQHSEYAQTSFAKLRQEEESARIFNYLAPARNPCASEEVIAAGLHARLMVFDKIKSLHEKKNFKIITLFAACSFFDRYMATIGWSSFPQSKLTALATACMVLAGKVEEPVQPCFSRMIACLSEKEQATLSKADVRDLEADILSKLQFDLSKPTPLPALDRLLRLTNYQENGTVKAMSEQLCRLLLSDPSFLDFLPSEIAAGCLIISINIYERDVQRVKIIKAVSDSLPNLFDEDEHLVRAQLQEGTQQLLPFKLQPLEAVLPLTGHCPQSLLTAMRAVVSFVWQELSPNRLEGFSFGSLQQQ